MGYVLPNVGSASTTQFTLGTELASGTSCGASGWANNASPGSGKPGGGPGFLYAAINQLGFGANPSVKDNGGPGAACGKCYQLTPISKSGHPLPGNALTFQIIDECPAAADPSTLGATRSVHCGQCTVQDKNDFNQTFHFDIAADAMNQKQYNTFFNGVTDGSNWNEIIFQSAACSTQLNPDPPIKDWGCIDNCSNNEKDPVCASIIPSGSSTTATGSVIGSMPTGAYSSTPSSPATTKSSGAAATAAPTQTLPLSSGAGAERFEVGLGRRVALVVELVLFGTWIMA
ncbi:hypothetical protein MMC09_000499 [Bachmanniomyces sp. S44760]|nr:hypothetical protein [Bachmanniomyces sp. S44760]